MAFVPVIDGDLLPVHPLAAISSGAGAAVPLLIGTNSEEFRLFLVPPGTIGLVSDDVLTAMALGLGATQEVIDLYRANRPDSSPGDVLAALITDKYFWLPALAVADARSGAPAATYVYEFAWGNPPIGAGHGLEIPFVFDNLSAEGAALAIGPNPPPDLAKDMHAAWIRFAATSDPGWPSFGRGRQVRFFDAGGGSVELDPRCDEREIWPES